jgi:hypothetical protein
MKRVFSFPITPNAGRRAESQETCGWCSASRRPPPPLKCFRPSCGKLVHACLDPPVSKAAAPSAGCVRNGTASVPRPTARRADPPRLGPNHLYPGRTCEIRAAIHAALRGACRMPPALRRHDHYDHRSTRRPAAVKRSGPCAPLPDNPRIMAIGAARHRHCRKRGEAAGLTPSQDGRSCSGGKRARHQRRCPGDRRSRFSIACTRCAQSPDP